MKFLLSFLLFFSVTFAQDINEFDEEFGSKKEILDPLSGYNRAMTGFNDFFYVNVFNPVARGYAYVVPKPARTAIDNFFDNLMFPIRFINNLLQFKFKAAGEETLRFIANTIIGFGGLTDGAKYYDLQRHDEDFGQTLGYWGVGGGFHIVLPFLGPSNLRDVVGFGGDYFADPVSYLDPALLSIGLKSYNRLNNVSLDPDGYENLKKDAVDLYPFLRDAYEQNRNYQIGR
jgi:abc-type transporter, ATPase component|nr:VacJ family lipoprotein [uncultured Campylobacter sp.]